MTDTIATANLTTSTEVLQLTIKTWDPDFEDLPGYDLLKAIIRKLAVVPPVPYIGRTRIGVYGLDNCKVRGIAQLQYNGRPIKTKRFYSRNERQMLLLRWRLQYDLMGDGLKKSRFKFLIRLVGL